MLDVRGRRLALLLVALVACGDDPPQSMHVDTGGTSTGDGSTGSQMPSTGAESGEVALEGHTDVVLHPEQPMVVDVVLTLSHPAQGSIEHASDAGVRVSLMHTSADHTTHTFRARGLAPDAEHTLSWSAETADGDLADGTLVLTTLPALPGFVAGFEIEALAGRPEPLHRMFDLGAFPAGDRAGLVMVDALGITRWYIGDTNVFNGPEAVWAAAHLLDDGTVAYLHGFAFHVKDELGHELHTVTPEDLSILGLHHEVLQLPNGNFMSLGYTFRDVDYPAQMGGTQRVAGDLIVEFTIEGSVVWIWDTFDHLDPLRVRDGFEQAIFDPQTEQFARDWTHGNGLEYDASDDSVLFSMRHQDWIIEIDRPTGDVVWRLGEEGDFALSSGSWFFHQHCPQWQPDGSLLLYDNGVGNPHLPDDQQTSRAVRYALDESDMTALMAWEDDAEDFIAPIAGDADRLPRGHLLVLDSSITDGPGQFHARIRELDPQAAPMTVWALRSPPNHFIYRATAHERLVGEPAQ